MRYAKLAFALSGLATVLFAAEPFAGTWKLNLEKSKYKTGTPPKEQTLTIAESGSDLDVRINGTAADGTAISSHYTVRKAARARSSKGPTKPFPANGWVFFPPPLTSSRPRYRRNTNPFPTLRVPAGGSLIDLSPIRDSFKGSAPVHRRYFVPKSFDVQSNIGPVLNPVQDAHVHVQESPSNEWSDGQLQLRLAFP